jgi:hypothetical protein
VLFLGAHRHVVAYVEQLDAELRAQGYVGLTRVQRFWLAFCITGMLVTSVLSWAEFERSSAGTYAQRALSRMFRDSEIPWDHLVGASMRLLFRLYRVTSGTLIVDDTERKRSKQTEKIWGVHRMKDKKTNGYIMGQEIVVLVLVTRTVTLPVGFEFYHPDPTLKAWKEMDIALKEKGVPKADRPTKPQRSKDFPTKQGLGMRLIRQFRHRSESAIKVEAILADAAYMSPYWLTECSKVYSGVQVISQIKKDQIVRAGGKPPVSAEEFFKSARSQTLDVKLRGMDAKQVTIASARLQVQSLGKTLLVVAIRYDDDKDYRYLAATDLSWRSLDVVHKYAFRWLIEVFNQDWKLYGAWGNLACQHGEEGARQGVILSLLLDHFLLAHPDQLRLGLGGQPLLTVGSMQRKLQLQCLLEAVEHILETDSPSNNLREFASRLENLTTPRCSNKHLAGKLIETREPSPSLEARFKRNGRPQTSAGQGVDRV